MKEMVMNDHRITDKEVTYNVGLLFGLCHDIFFFQCFRFDMRRSKVYLKLLNFGEGKLRSNLKNKRNTKFRELTTHRFMDMILKIRPGQRSGDIQVRQDRNKFEKTKKVDACEGYAQWVLRF